MNDNLVSKTFSEELCTAFANRLAKNFRLRKKWTAARGIGAYRVYDLDIPEMPLMIDIYNDSAVVYERFLDDIHLDSFKPLFFIITKVLHISSELIFLKKRRRQKGLQQYQKLSSQKRETIVSEGKLKFAVNLTDYLDTGLFLDHRPLRRWLAEGSWRGTHALNLFSYTGSISVSLAKAGAQVTSVDLSNTYQTWAKKNFTLNHLNPNDHHFVTEDIITWIKQTPQYTKYDLIVIDPPSFSNSAKMKEHFDLVKDHGSILLAAKKILSPDGIIIFSGNKHRFALGEDVIQEFQYLNITKESIPSDFRNPKIHFCYLLGREGKLFSALAHKIYLCR